MRTRFRPPTLTARNSAIQVVTGASYRVSPAPGMRRPETGRNASGPSIAPLRPSACEEEALRERPLSIQPLLGALEFGTLAQLDRLVLRVLVRALGPDRLARGEADSKAEPADRDRVRAAAGEVHLDVPL